MAAATGAALLALRVVSSDNVGDSQEIIRAELGTKGMTPPRVAAVPLQTGVGEACLSGQTFRVPPHLENGSAKEPDYFLVWNHFSRLPQQTEATLSSFESTSLRTPKISVLSLPVSFSWVLLVPGLDIPHPMATSRSSVHTC